MQDSFGARLRRRREEQNIPLVTIADQTKIKLALLEALERDDVRQWPAGIFRRAFIRAYAHAIGLNPDEVVREFIEVHPEPADVAAAAAIAAAIENERPNAGSSGSLRSIVGSAFGSFTRRKRSPEAVQPATVDRVEVARSEAAQADVDSADGAAGFDPVDELDDFAPVELPELRLPSRESVQEPPAVAEEPPVVPSWSSLQEPVSPAPDLAVLASLCTDFGRVEHADEVQPLLQRAAALLDASGLIVWLWDGASQELKPALVHGYSDRVLAQLPGVRRSDDNPTAAAFRSGEPCTIGGNDHASGALALPLLAPRGCAGVLAIELQQGTATKTESACAVATILASLLSQLVGGARTEDMQESRSSSEASAPSGEVARLSAAATH